jgi:predicted alpha/beta-fold hydrolase
MPAASSPPFEPHPLIRGGHAQTLAGVYLPWSRVAHQAVQHRVTLDDGDQIVLHDDCPTSWREGDGACLAMHGLGGSYESGYMRRVAHKLAERGVRVFRMDLRGCGAGEGLARLPTHSGRWADAAAALQFLAQEMPRSPTVLVGFSLGGTIALNLAAEVGSARCGNLVGIMTVCPPVDLHAVKWRFDAAAGRPYDLHFVGHLWEKTLRRAVARPDAPRFDRSRRPRRVRDFDQLVTAPLAGYRSVDEYYSATSPGPRLADIRVPTLILSANDDPVVPTEPLSRYRTSDAVEIVVTRHGGHLGYVARAGLDPDRRWMDWRVVEWVSGQCSADRVAERLSESSAAD